MEIEDLQYIKSDILVKLKILKTVCETDVEYSEDMDLEELKEIYQNILCLYLQEKEIQDRKDLIGKIKWLGYEDIDILHSLNIKQLIILYQNILKENNLTEKDMDDYVSIVGILVMFADR